MSEFLEKLKNDDFTRAVVITGAWFGAIAGGVVGNKMGKKFHEYYYDE